MRRGIGDLKSAVRKDVPVQVRRWAWGAALTGRNDDRGGAFGGWRVAAADRQAPAQGRQYEREEQSEAHGRDPSVGWPWRQAGRAHQGGQPKRLSAANIAITEMCYRPRGAAGRIGQGSLPPAFPSHICCAGEESLPADPPPIGECDRRVRPCQDPFPGLDCAANAGGRGLASGPPMVWLIGVTPRSTAATRRQATAVRRRACLQPVHVPGLSPSDE